MDSLIDELEGDSLGLNIVCESKAVKLPKANKPKKKNKYEKRRAKARRAKEEKTAEPSSISSPQSPLRHGRDNVAHQDKKSGDSEIVDKDPVSTDTNVDDVQDLVIQSMQHEDQLTTETNEVEDTSEGAKQNKTTDTVSSKGNHLIKGRVGGVESESLPDASRKNQHFVTTQVLQDEAKRAQYLSTYHARPYEMDRKSGAVSHIQESKDSTHIFGDDDIEENDRSCPFSKCGLHPKIVRTITSDKFNLKRPTVIQCTSWNEMVKDKSSATRKNLFVQSETGSGKTLAYFIPVLQSLAIDTRTKKAKKVDRNLGGTRTIIICPTRELATQTYTVAEKLCQNSFPWLVAGCLSGGEKRKSEKARLRKGVSILIATPGRLLDHLEKTDCLLMALKGKLEWIVLDESDRLLDMGLGSQVEQIVQIIRANQSGSGIKRDGITWQSILVSATITVKIEKLASKLLGGNKWVWARAKKNVNDEKLIHENENGITLDGKMELSSAAPKQLTQLHMVVSSKLRLTALIAFLAARVQRNERVVVFMSTCDGVDYHHKLFNAMNCILAGGDQDTNDKDNESTQGIFSNKCSLHRLHGNIPHRERHTILTGFANVNKTGASILLTTDVTARGLNLPGVDWIVQYDPPCETADYVHRAGRAARAGKSGHALLFLLPSETQYIEVLTLRGLPDVTALSLSTTLQNAAKICPDITSEGLSLTGQGNGQSVSGGRVGEAFSSAVQVRLEDCIMEDDKNYKASLAKKIEHNSESSDKNQRRKERREAKNAAGPLLESARAAYFSYIRGYSAKEKAVRHIFSARALHLGHVARSFALKEQPKDLSKAHRKSRQEDTNVLKSTGRKRNSNLAFGDKKNREAGEERSAIAIDGDASAPSSVFENLMLRKKVKKEKKKKIISFDDEAGDIGVMPKGTSTRQMKERMLAAAKKIQGGGMEFF